MANYKNLTNAGKGLQGYGEGVKILGFVAVAVGGVGFVVLRDGSPAAGALGVAAIVAGCIVGLALHWAGTVVAAMGEAMFAVRDIAVNTSETAEAMTSGTKPTQKSR